MRSLYPTLAALALLAGCQTQFLGDPHISINTCQARCTSSGMQMSGMVYMGEYSSACICEPPKPNASAPAAAAGAMGATAGVVMQMRRQQQQQQQQQSTSGHRTH